MHCHRDACAHDSVGLSQGGSAAPSQTRESRPKGEKRMDNHGHKNRTCICTLSTPSGNRTRVSPVAGAYSTTRPTVSEAVSPPSARCCLHNFWESIWLVCARFYDNICAGFDIPASFLLFSMIFGMETVCNCASQSRMKVAKAAPLWLCMWFWSSPFRHIQSVISKHWLGIYCHLLEWFRALALLFLFKLLGDAAYNKVTDGAGI